jgi:hypothetical protein
MKQFDGLQSLQQPLSNLPHWVIRAHSAADKSA